MGEKCLVSIGVPLSFGKNFKNEFKVILPFKNSAGVNIGVNSWRLTTSRSRLFIIYVIILGL